ncbi:MAG: hypothetical protein NVSMB28_06790 [Collimonas sp.]
MKATMKKMGQGVGRIMILAAALGAFASAATAADTPPQQGANLVQINNFSFSPQTLTVPAGTTVTWVNHDEEPHTVTSDASPRVFNSPPRDTGEQFSFTFATPGTYKYFCAIHPHMVGIVVVK